MNGLKRIITAFLIFSLIAVPATALAREGDGGYEGGISAGVTPTNSTVAYQEVCFVSGEPIVFTGQMTIKKSMKKDNTTKKEVLSTTYTFKDMKNVAKAATLTRSAIVLKTSFTPKEDGQVVEETVMEKPYTETVKVGTNSYVLKSIEFTRTSLIENKPAVQYYSGNLWQRKTYQLGTSAASPGKVTVEETGSFYGYDQYWSTTESQTLEYVVQSEMKKGDKIDSWGGTANIRLAMNTAKQLKKVEERTGSIPFTGGYIQSQYNDSILEYQSRMPEFDANGVSTDRILTKSDTLKLESFPVQTRLPVADLGHLKGHWVEETIRQLYSLEVLKGNASIFTPEQAINRAEFVAALVRAAKAVPPDPTLSKTSSSTKSVKKEEVLSPFSDISTEHLYFNEILDAYQRGIALGRGGNNFMPNISIPFSEALVMCIRALGLESIAPTPVPVTTFADNDQIPSYARNAFYVAEQIGLIQADAKGNIYPNAKLTKGKAALLLNNLIIYMREGIQADYRERFVGFGD